MSGRMRGSLLVTALSLLAAPTWSRPQGEEGSVAAAIAQVARTQKGSYEDTCKAHNEQLTVLFRSFVAEQGGEATAGTIRRFHALLAQQGLTSFEDFLAAETRPLRYRRDPISGATVPYFGPLGSDIINPWLAALQILPGKPVEEQPIYRLAGNALREHIDFALIGVRDPNLSLEQLPPKLRENATDAYRRLNPTNRFDGGFDHPLFYATVREAARKMFREDYPHLRITMADLVKPEAAGGFGIRSCLLCHNRSHTGVYERLLAQGLYLEARATELPAASPQAREARNTAAIFHQAAETVRTSFPREVDVAAARRSLTALSRDNLARLRPGYPDFCATLNKLGCLACHSRQARVEPDKDPREYGAYVLDLNDYYQTDNIKALVSAINFDNLDRSRLLLKATAKLSHAGAEEVQLSAAQVKELRDSLEDWIHGFDGAAAPAAPAGQGK